MQRPAVGTQGVAATGSGSGYPHTVTVPAGTSLQSSSFVSHLASRMVWRLSLVIGTGLRSRLKLSSPPVVLVATAPVTFEMSGFLQSSRAAWPAFWQIGRAHV